MREEENEFFIKNLMQKQIYVRQLTELSNITPWGISLRCQAPGNINFIFPIILLMRHSNRPEDLNQGRITMLSLVPF